MRPTAVAFHPVMRKRVCAAILLSATGIPAMAMPDFNAAVLPVLTKHCNTCHSTEKQKGDLDLERFASPEEVRKNPAVWEHVLQQITDGEMPPKKEPPLTEADKKLLLDWTRGMLDEIALSNAGDPGPVSLRRLSNTEYTWTLRDLTSVPSLDPAREFPTDGAAGEGFTNAGAALVMSPSLLSKYLDAARAAAAHMVLLPDGIRFSPSTLTADHAEESLHAIRDFYARYSVAGAGSEVNLQGVQFNTADGGVLPLEVWLRASLTERAALRSGSRTLPEAAAGSGLNAKYFDLLWDTLNGSSGNPSSFILSQIRRQWEQSGPEQAEQLAGTVRAWQQVLWRFSQVGHIGKKGGPAAWQMPMDPVTESAEVRLALPPPDAAGMVTVRLVTTPGPAADGSPDPETLAVWENLRLVRNGTPDLPLKEIRAVLTEWHAVRHQTLISAEAALLAADELISGRAAKSELPALAEKYGIHPALLTAWSQLLGAGAGPEAAGPLLTTRSGPVGGYDFVRGWAGEQDLSIVANRSETPVNIPGLLAPQSVAVHPAPGRQAVISWISPVSGRVRITGAVKDAHNGCGNGVDWNLQLMGPGRHLTLAMGSTSGGEPAVFGAADHLSIRAGDLVSLSVGPKNGDHTCDLTRVDLRIDQEQHTWDLARDVSPDILEGNPHRGVWRFSSLPVTERPAPTVIPEGSLLSRWSSAATSAERAALAGELGNLLRTKPGTLPADSPDARLLALLTDFDGPLLLQLQERRAEPAWMEAFMAAYPDGMAQAGPDPALFGPQPEWKAVPPGHFGVQAPSILTFELPASLARGRELVATARHAGGAEARTALQMRLLAGGNGPPVAFGPGFPFLAPEGSPAAAFLTGSFSEFRRVFPEALCYTKIVPADEVVTLSLYHREDGELRRLMLDDAQAAEIDRLWENLRFTSQEPLKLVDVFDQLWQFATQDGDPSLFEPMREPIRRRAADFRISQEAAQPAQLEAIVEFADRAWRRPLTASEKQGLRAFHHRLRGGGMEHDESLRLVLVRILTAPAFLYRGERPAPGSTPVPVQPVELASRLSYFLWASAPDAELTAAAASLQNPAVLTAQTRRMVRDPKIRRLAEEFGCQWLQVRGLSSLDEKSARHFPEFTDLRGDMEEETVQFLTDLLQENRPVFSLLDADHTFVNDRLAAYYGISSAASAAGNDGWRKVGGMRAQGRGGMLGFAAILARQSGASRTSPILRGNWLSETVLGERLPRPPKDVPVLPEEAPDTLTERQLIERHSSDAACSGCHRRIDPFGFALEGFDAIGRRRTQDHAGRPVSTEAVLPDGTRVEGLAGLRDWLAGPRRRDFVRQFCRRLLGYALGRAVQLSDRPLLEAMADRLEAEGGHAGTAIEMIVLSPQFRQVRGRDYPSP